jgi:hypothetical protein
VSDEPILIGILLGEERDDCPICVAMARGARPSELLEIARTAPLPDGVSVFFPEVNA